MGTKAAECPALSEKSAAVGVMSLLSLLRGTRQQKSNICYQIIFPLISKVDCVRERLLWPKYRVPKERVFSPFFNSWVLRTLGVFYSPKFKVGSAID